MPTSPAGCSAEANLRAALLLLETLQRQGLRRVVLCPGSRSAPLAVAAGLLAARTSAHPALDLYTAVDERSAAFHALGLSRADACPAAVITTSGTAVANLLPAVVEADTSAIPLLLLTADRPARLKGCGANQTVNQEQFLHQNCRGLLSGDARGLAWMSDEALQQLSAQAWQGCLGLPAGPVHLNLPFDEPLHADGAVLQQLATVEPEPASSTQAHQETDSACGHWPASAELPFERLGLNLDTPGAVVVGPWRGDAASLAATAEALLRWQQRTGWPVLADGLSGLRGWPGLQLIHSYDLLLADGHGLGPAPQLLRLGAVPASRRLQQWMASGTAPQLLLSGAEPRNLDALGTASVQIAAGLGPWLERQPAALWQGQPGQASRSQAARWQALDAQAQQQLDAHLLGRDLVTEPGLARALSRLLPSDVPLMLANSSPVRDWDSFAAAPQAPRPVFSFRGASGIDGTLSLATGLACAMSSLLLVCGDLALLHDANGWLWLQQLQQRGVRLTVVLVNNAGGGIFEQLMIRTEPEDLLDFERLFAMPQALDQLALAQLHGAATQRLERLEQLPQALAWALQQPMALLELRTDRRADAELRRELRRRMAALSLVS